MIPNKKPKNPSNETQKLTDNSKITPKLSDPQIITQSADSKAKPRSKVVSPTVRSTIPSQFPGISDQTPATIQWWQLIKNRNLILRSRGGIRFPIASKEVTAPWLSFLTTYELQLTTCFLCKSRVSENLGILNQQDHLWA